MNAPFTPLIGAAQDGDETQLLKLLKSQTLLRKLLGLQPRFNSTQRYSAAVWAASQGHEGCLALLIAQGFNINQKTQTSETIAAVATRNGHSRCLTLILEAGYDIDTQDSSGFTAAMWAALSNREHCLRVLIQAGCDLHYSSVNGDTALMLAAQRGHLFCVDMLVAADEYRTLQLALAGTLRSASSLADRTTRARL